MVQVLVKLPSGPKPSLAEWRIVELQGELMTSGDGSSAGQYIGDLHYTKAGVPVLLVGHHILYGKEQDVDKPFLVIEKTPATVSDAERTREYCVRSIVTKKVVFRSRPKPIVSSTASKTGKTAAVVE